MGSSKKIVVFGLMAILSLPSGIHAAPGGISFSSPSLKTSCRLNSDYARVDEVNRLDGQATLAVDSMNNGATWNQCFKTNPGLFQPGKCYAISFKCRNLELGKDSKTFFLIRPFNAPDDNSDLSQESCVDIDDAQRFTLRCKIPSGVNDYSFQIHTKNHVRAIIGPVDIAEVEYRPEKILPPDGKAPQNVKLKIPVGSQEFAIDLPKTRASLVLTAESFGVDPKNPDNVGALNKAIEKCRKLGATKLSLAKGVYRFTSDTPVTFKTLKDFEFDGNGSTLVFLKKRSDMIQISGCERVLFHKFNLDWDWEKDPLASVVKVESIGPNGSYADFRFVDYQRFPNPGTRMAYLDMLDPKTMSVSSEGGFGMSLEFHKGGTPTQSEWLSGNLLRIKNQKNYGLGFRLRFKPGQLFRLSHYYYDMNGVAMQDNAHLTIRDVNLYSCPGHAFLANGDQHHWQLIRTNIVRPPGTTRPITCTADHHHIGQSKGFLKIENCEFSLGNDDCLNIHDCSAYGTRTAEKTLNFSNLRDPFSYHVGDLIEFRNEDYSPVGFEAKVSALRHLNGKKWELDFDRPLPGKPKARFVIFNRRYDSRNIIVRNSFFHDNRARGLLLLGRDITVENNRFLRNQMGCIKIETGYTLTSWCEGYGASNIVIRGNVFDYANPRHAFTREKRPVIYMSVYLKSDPSTQKTDYPILRDILIENNKFIECPGVIAYACSVDNVIVRDNTIENALPRLIAFPYRGAVGTAHATGVFVTGNTWFKSPYMPEPGLIVDPETVRDAFCWNNKVVEK